MSTRSDSSTTPSAGSAYAPQPPPTFAVNCGMVGPSINNNPASAEGSALHKPVRGVPVCKGVLVVVQDEEDKEDIGVEVMITAEDAAAGFRLPMPLLQM